jgi:hypothetical protein
VRHLIVPVYRMPSFRCRSGEVESGETWRVAFPDREECGCLIELLKLAARLIRSNNDE